ncbi:MAG TPA: hypothetical protein PKG56_06380 [Chitinophagaceae bacterium]|nr:hypothetical protein [Chitinophagaceae bacterium]MCC6636088.1 hypothetical protein [Chitinophagaceae bacterium]HMZ45225.1 hypothetical protein [Chitinophagaceae bacterium]HNL83004.1 hypothetical protein [Chitinophagaceae bacterium]
MQLILTVNMTPQQKKVLDDAVKTKLKNEKILTGGNKYINPIRKVPKKKKEGLIEKPGN